MADLDGQTLGAYRIESHLGVGGMGEVYRAVHTLLDRPAAIKVLHANQAADPTFQARFLREARAAAALRHPNIVEVFDFGEQDGASYLVMELVPDGSLRTLLRQRTAGQGTGQGTGQGWSLGLGVDLVRQVAEGLAYAHAHGMVHRDIKPDNLLLRKLAASPATTHDPANERYEVKISDFGLARLMEDGGELTTTGMVMGTPTYMSPEQCQGATLDGRSDLYSLGVVLYEVATGAPPFRAKSLSEAVFKHISAPPVPPRAVRPDLPVALEDVILRCLEKRPEDRYATGTEIAEALDGALADTELRTIITTRDSASGATSGATPASAPGATPSVTPAATPEALADSTAPTVADSTPGRRASTPPTRPTPPPAPHTPPAPVIEPVIEPAAAPIIAASAADAAGSDDATIEASTPAPRRPAATPAAEQRRNGPSVRTMWPQPEDGAPNGAGQAEGAGFIQMLRTRPQAVAIGGGVALLLIVGLIVAIVSNAHSGANSLAKTPTATVKPSATASPTPVETLTFQDSLATASGKWPLSSHSFYGGNGYELAGGWASFSPVTDLGNGTIAVSTRALSGDASQFYGIVLRATSDSQPTGYFFGIDQNRQWTFSRLSQGNGVNIVAPTTNSHITVGANASNTITVRSSGGHFVFYINGAQVGQADDATFASGRVGLINTEHSLHVVYNNFTVTVPQS